MKSNKLFIKALFFAVAVFLSPDLLFAETVYVKKNKTKITEESSPKSNVVAVLDRGVTLEIIDKKGKFYFVKLPDGNKGWVFKFKVGKVKPLKENKGGDLFAALAGERSLEADEASTGASIRGLSKISENYAKDKRIKPAHIQAVKNMENFKVTQENLDNFMKSEKLGEYSEME